MVTLADATPPATIGLRDVAMVNHWPLHPSPPRQECHEARRPCHQPTELIAVCRGPGPPATHTSETQHPTSGSRPTVTLLAELHESAARSLGFRSRGDRWLLATESYHLAAATAGRGRAQAIASASARDGLAVAAGRHGCLAGCSGKECALIASGRPPRTDAFAARTSGWSSGARCAGRVGGPLRWLGSLWATGVRGCGG